MNSIREIREKYRTDADRFDYMVSSCEFVTKKFMSAWNLKAIGKENCILQTGYPRNDFLSNFSNDDILRIKRMLGINSCNKKIVLYAPTWRDNQHDADKGYTYDNQVDFDYLKEKLHDEYIILFRAHYLVANSFDFDAYQGFIYDVDENEKGLSLIIAVPMAVTILYNRGQLFMRRQIKKKIM